MIPYPVDPSQLGNVRQRRLSFYIPLPCRMMKAAGLYLITATLMTTFTPGAFSFTFDGEKCIYLEILTKGGEGTSGFDVVFTDNNGNEIEPNGRLAPGNPEYEKEAAATAEFLEQIDNGEPFLGEIILFLLPPEEIPYSVRIDEISLSIEATKGTVAEDSLSTYTPPELALDRLIVTIDRGPIAGQVKTTGGQGIEGVTVRAVSLNMSSEAETITDAQGRFRFENIGQEVTLEIVEAGFSLKESTITATPGERNADFLVSKAPIAGRVTIEVPNNPVVGVAGVSIEIESASDGKVIATQITNAEGYYEHSGLDSDERYNLRPSLEGYTFGFINKVDSGELNVDFSVVKAPIGGRVTQGRPLGDPIPDVVIIAQSINNDEQFTTETDNDGNYLLKRLPLDTYRVEADGSILENSLEFPPLPSVLIGTLDADFNTPFIIDGVISSGGQGVAGISVRATGTDGAIGDSTVTDEAGAYELILGENGTFNITAAAPDERPLMTLASNFVNPISARESQPLNFEASEGIEGRVTTDGEIGIPGATITGSQPLRNGTSQNEITATTDVDGRYRLDGFQVDGEKITVTLNLPGYDINPTTRIVESGTSQVDFIGTGLVSGKVEFLDGDGAANVVITLSSNNPLFGIRTQETDADGFYEFKDVPDGATYTAVPSRSGYEFDFPERATETGTSELDFIVTQSPPSISPIQDLFLGRNTSSQPIQFTISDRETAVDNLILAASSDNPDVVAVENILLQGSGANRTVKVIPSDDTTGLVTIDVSVRDGLIGATSRSVFLVSVGLSPAYAVIDLGTTVSSLLSQQKGLTFVESTAASINNIGEVVGHVTTGGSSPKRVPFFYDGLDNGEAVTDLEPFLEPDLSSPLFNFEETVVLNDNSEVLSAFSILRFRSTPIFPFIEFAKDRGTFLYRHQTGDSYLTPNIDPLDINNERKAVGLSSSIVSGVFYDGGVVDTTDGELLAPPAFGADPYPLFAIDDCPPGTGTVYTVGTAINDNAHILSTAVCVGSGGTGLTGHLAIRKDGDTVVIPIDTRPGKVFVPTAINNAGDATGFIVDQVGDGARQDAAFEFDDVITNPSSWRYSAETQTLTDLKDLIPQGETQALDINENGQIVGHSTSRSSGQHAVLYQGDELFDLNDLIPTSSGWTLTAANSINDQGEIVGHGNLNGAQQAFLVVPATPIGRAVRRPIAARESTLQPTIVILKADDETTTADNAFIWNDSDKRLYAIRPLTARVSWPVSNVLTDTERVSSVVISVWPRDPQIHVVGTPVELEPEQNEDFAFSFLELSYATSVTTSVDTANKVFTSNAPGFSVLRFIETNGEQLDPRTQPVFFKVVRSVNWDDPDFLSETAWDIGKTMTTGPGLSQTSIDFPGSDNDMAIVARDNGAQFDGLAITINAENDFPAEDKDKDLATASFDGKNLLVFINDGITTAQTVIDTINDLTENRFNSTYQALSANGEGTAGVISIFIDDDPSSIIGSGVGMDFPGTTTASRVNIPDFTGFPGTELTAEFWLQTSNIAQSKIPISYAAPGHSNMFLFELTPNEVFRIYAFGSAIRGRASFDDGNWHHIAISWRSEDGNIRLYKDGQQVFERNGFIQGETLESTGYMVFGQDQDSLGGGFQLSQAFVGRMDEIRLWDRVRSQSEILGTMTRSLEGNEEGLISYWNFENTSGSTAPDVVAERGNDGVILAPASATEIFLGGLLTQTTAGGTVSHRDYPGRNGFILFEDAFYDGAGPNAAYDRNTRRGPIIPVNRGTSRTAKEENQMVVVWYRFDEIGIAWPDQPVRYELQWPAAAPRLVIADQNDSPILPESAFPEKHIYNQPDANLAGFNPNEEHAMVIDDKVTALRDDLNPLINASEPFTLLKFRDAITGEWRMQVYRVEAEDQDRRFHYLQEAGLEIQPPFPLFTLGVCTDTAGISGPIFEDVKGKIYAFAAGTGDSNAEIVVHYYYPLQPSFYFDLDGDGTNDLVEGTCVPFLNRGGGTPTDVVYNIHWPNEVPRIQIGDTLLSAKNGLPEIFNQAKAEVVFESVNPRGPLEPNPALRRYEDSVARIYDPLSERMVELAADFTRQSAFTNIKREREGFRDVFPDLPFVIRTRFLYDPDARTLIFRGVNVTKDQPPGSPLLLPNVMSLAERERLIALAPLSEIWRSKIIELYERTRNPNQLDIQAPFGSADKSLLIGLAKGFIVADEASEIEGAIKVTTIEPENPDDIIGSPVVVPEPFGAGPKALTVARAFTDRAAENFMELGRAVSVDFTNNDFIEVSNFGEVMPQAEFTIEFWIKSEAPQNSIPFNLGVTKIRANENAIGFAFAENAFAVESGFIFQFIDEAITLETGDDFFGEWQHFALTVERENDGGGFVIIYRNGGTEFIHRFSKLPSFKREPLALHLGKFNGSIDEVRVWSHARTRQEIERDMDGVVSGSSLGLVGYWRLDEGSGRKVRDVSGNGNTGVFKGSPTWQEEGPFNSLDPNGYITLAFNNDANLPGLPVSLSIIRMDCANGVFQGDLRVLPSDNVFDERLTLRHSGDFGGEPEMFEFEWYYHPGSQDPGSVPLDSEGNANPGWVFFPPPSGNPAGLGVNQITIGDGGQAGILVISDNRWMMRYRGYTNACGEDWSPWIGAPNKVPTEPQLAEGWIKRVLAALNPFDQRTADFRGSEVNTFASLLVSAGTRFEGDIAFNPDADAINSVGLIDIYQTVLRRGANLSINSDFNFQPANDALLLATSKLADLYMLLGNEAFGDAVDPTIGFTSASGDVGTLAPSIFAFQNQLDSLLAEELALLRGTDENLGAPVYNRLFWNFTRDLGQVAYQQTYNISDTEPRDGFIDVNDAAVLYPQGHGDAWGHYLTAIKNYYQLLQHPNFTWIPRSESLLLANIPIDVDFLDERKFANAAAARAKAGTEIVNLTYRESYVDEPDGQWQGYKDTDADRAWGVSGWGRRVGVGAYIDWVVGNAILPAFDPDPSHQGIDRIDRTTVLELQEISAEYGRVQAQMDKADIGLNPLGLAKGAISFDIDPNFLEVGSGNQSELHFEQIRDRALEAMENAVAVFDHANTLTQNLRLTQDSAAEFAANVADQELDYTNRLIEIFGYPYEGHIGPGQPYASGYNGPDLLYYNYVDVSELTGNEVPITENITAFFNSATDQFSDIPDSFEFNDTIMEVNYPLASEGWAFTVDPNTAGQRRAPGAIQLAISTIVQNNAAFEQGLKEYENLIADIKCQLGTITALYNVREEQISILNAQRNTIIGMNVAIAALNATQLALEAAAGIVRDLAEVSDEAIPKVAGTSNDVTFGLRAALAGATFLTAVQFEAAASTTEFAQNGLELGKEVVGLQTEIDLLVLDARYEVQQEIFVLESMIREEIPMRIGLFNLKEVIAQSLGEYQATLAEGVRILDERDAFRKRASGDISQNRFRDMTFRIFRNDAIQKYRAQFDLAARYVYLAATAYDYETTFLGSQQGSGGNFLTNIVRQRTLGEFIDGVPIAGRNGLADSLARLTQNFSVLDGQLGFNNPELENAAFSLREELFRKRSSTETATDPGMPVNAGAEENETWPEILFRHRVDNLWDIPEFRRYARPFAPEPRPGEPGEPGLVIPFGTTVTFGLNYFGWPLVGGDSSYDPSRFATKIRAVGVVFNDYPLDILSQTPRVYLIPTGTDILRSAAGNTLATREFKIIDQKIPVPFPIGQSDITNDEWIPINDSLGGSFIDIRRYSSFRAFSDIEFDESESPVTASRLIGRSVWNTNWILIIPGGNLLFDADEGLDVFIDNVSDIQLNLFSYSVSGN